ncbi:hypothetical protein QZH41_003269 [Actinostola sp. cb2023]|nr:hypothetical protein QZH41_003269 [Actinostola sp. cb2023]
MFVPTTRGTLRLYSLSGTTKASESSDESTPASSPGNLTLIEIYPKKGICNATDTFLCDNSRCIPKMFECDHEDDCADGSDEHPGCVMTTCKTNEITCDNKVCVHWQMLCNGEDDCGDGSDERNCGSVSPPCGDNHWRCPNDSTCIQKTKVCDNKMDCPDGADEGPGCGFDGCRNKNGGCSQLCIDIPADDHVPYLYFSTRNEIRKIDIPLAREYNFDVRGLVDTIGIDFDWKEQRIYWSDLYKHTLSRCFMNGTGQEDLITEGLITTEDNFTTVLFVNRNEVRGISLDPNVTVDLIVSTFLLQHAVAVDFDYRHGYVYWSDVKEGTISRVSINGSLKEIVVRGKA